MGMMATDGRCVRRRIPSTAACVAAYIVMECAYEDGSLFDSVNGICPSNAHAMNNLLYQMQLGTISATGHELFDCDFVAGNFPEIPDLELDISLDSAAVGPFLRPEAFGFDHAAARRLVGGWGSGSGRSESRLSTRSSARSSGSVGVAT